MRGSAHRQPGRDLFLDSNPQLYRPRRAHCHLSFDLLSLRELAQELTGNGMPSYRFAVKRECVARSRDRHIKQSPLFLFLKRLVVGLDPGETFAQFAWEFKKTFAVIRGK